MAHYPVEVAYCTDVEGNLSYFERWVETAARVLRFEPGHGLTTEKDAGEWLRVAGQLLTIASVDGDDVTFEEAYNGSQVQASWPEVAVHAPGARKARYVGGSGTPRPSTSAVGHVISSSRSISGAPRPW